jgi:hypothetical protein
VWFCSTWSDRTIWRCHATPRHQPRAQRVGQYHHDTGRDKEATAKQHPDDLPSAWAEDQSLSSVHCWLSNDQCLCVDAGFARE